MTTHPQTLLIAGYYGFGNAGDEAILSAIISDLRALRSDLKMTVVSGNPPETEAAHGLAAVPWTDVEKIMQAVAASDLVILGGGGLFHDYWGFDPDSLLTQHHAGIAFFGGIPLLASLLDKPMMMYAVGVGPLFSAVGQAHTRAAFDAATFITVRDPGSKAMLESIGVPMERVRVTADPAFRFLGDLTPRPPSLKGGGSEPFAANFPPLKGRESAPSASHSPSPLRGKGPRVGGQEDHPLLAVALREWNIGVLPDYWERQVAEALDVFVERRGGAIVFVPFQEGKGFLQNDSAVAERARSRMRNNERTTILPENSSVREKAAALSQCDLILGMRLHSLIFAISSAVPVVGLAYDPKVRSVMKMAGVEEYAIDLGAVTAGRLVERMESAFAERSALSARLKESAGALSESARENARLAVALLGGAKLSPVTPATLDVLKRLVLSQTRKRIEQEAQAQMLAAQSAERGQAVADLQTELGTRANEYARVMAELQRRNQAEVEDRDRAIAELGAQADEREQRMADLRSAAAQEAEAHNRIMADLRSESQRQVNDRDRTVADLQSQVGEREQALGKIHASKHWKLMSLYWRAYDGASAAYSGFREALRKLLPVPLRRSVVQAYRRARPPRPADQPVRIETLTALDGLSPVRHDVVCFPVIDWDFRFQRPQQLAMQFARDGHRCFYLRTTLHQNGPAPLLQNIAGRVVGVQLPGAPDLNIYSSAITSAMLDKFISALNDVRKTAGIVEAVCIVDLPFWTPLALAARERWGWKIVYDCMDEHGGFTTNSPIMLQQEETLIKESDLVVVTSRALHRKIAPHARRALVLPNAVDFEHFNRPRASVVIPSAGGARNLDADPEMLRGFAAQHDIRGGAPPSGVNPLAHLPRPIIGFYGAISNWFDVEMVRAAATRRPDWQFVLIGDMFGADVSPFKPLRNVHLLGEKTYDELPAYLQQFDVACIPFLITKLTRATNPVKFYEYLSAGKPVVSVELPELESLREYFYPASSADEFVLQLEAALRENDPARADARIEFARANTWNHRYQVLKDAVRQLYGKAAVIVVSYNNLDYLRRCLETLLAKTERPNFEVIVVDNGSDASVVEYLQDSARREPRLQAILNGENLGFARANNIGIQAASDADFVVLLNDDTVVTRGWLTRLIRHLDDPTVGLVGPVTNCAANEAQIRTDYQAPDDIESFAESICRARAGRAFDIPMLAMYCVAMRKSLIDQIGLLDERFETGMFEDDDFSLRARCAGFRIVCAEDVFVHHWGRASFSRMDQRQYDRLFAANRKKFEAKWEIKWQPHRYRSQS